jgi:hypothetical protein
MEALVFVGIGLVVIGAVVLSFYLKAKRREAFRAFAQQHGFQYEEQDRFNLLGWPFALFRRGDGRGIENLVWGTWRGEPIQAFDYWYYVETTDSKGRRQRSYRRFSCALVEVDAAFPHLELAREGLFSRLADHVGLEDIEFESPEFNRRYNVKAKDRKFAYELLDARMLQWLVNSDQGYAFEIVASRILVYGRRSKPTALPPLIDAGMTFRSNIPSVALRLHPA